jgi:methanogenic corrinoid protein MtbC1
MDNQLIELMSDLLESETIKTVREKILQGIDPLDILDYARSAMTNVGKRFESGEYSIPELVMAGDILRDVSDVLKPFLAKNGAVKKSGKVLLGTVAGDVHDIGKDIVAFMIEANGFDVLDIGIDVSTNTFVEKIKDFKPQVVGLSGFLTRAIDSMKKTIEAIEYAGLRDTIKIMIGGGLIDDEVRKYVRADAYGKDVMAAVGLCKQWINEGP